MMTMTMTMTTASKQQRSEDGEKNKMDGDNMITTTMTNGTELTSALPTKDCSSDVEGQHNAWLSPGSAAFDFRSALANLSLLYNPITTPDQALRDVYSRSSGDTVTTPTASMLLATQNCTLLDDVFQEDATTNSLEAYVADMIGKEAGLFVMSGTMGNQLSIRTALQGPPHSVLADARSHVYGW